MTKTFAKYVVVGITTNALGYLVYIALTAVQVSPKIAMTCLYLVGATAGFIGNRQWTFQHTGGALPTFLRYALAHAIGYFMNLALLAMFSDVLGYPHQIVQAIAICVVAVYLFVAFRFFVFRRSARSGVT
jgi:putative flippase GtrA